jgi:oxygen-dependent protoporphyrinogen oxidase
LFLGGAGRGGQESLSAEALLAIAAEEMRDVLGITAAPVFARINRFDRALPQSTVGHTDRMAAIAADAATLPGLELAGAVYRGIGIPDSVQSGVDAAARTLAFIATASSTPTASLT